MVKKLLVFAAIALLMALALSIVEGQRAAGSPLACESIRDADQRNYCRAVSKRQRSYCELIKNRDLRFRCRAEVK